MKIRDMFVPSKGKVLVEADGSQAEARVVAWKSHDPQMNHLFDSGLKIHRHVAAKIFNTTYEEIQPSNSDRRYYLAKQTVHSGNYGRGADKLRKLVMKETDGEIVLPLEECARFDRIYHDEFPNVRSIYWAWVEGCFRKHRLIANPLGRKRICYGRPNNQTYRELYAWYPQSTVADWLNMGMLAFHRAMQEGGNPLAQVLMQVHDSFLWECKPGMVKEACAIANACLKIPIKIDNETHYIPTEFKSGPTWGQMKEVEL